MVSSLALPRRGCFFFSRLLNENERSSIHVEGFQLTPLLNNLGSNGSQKSSDSGFFPFVFFLLVPSIIFLLSPPPPSRKLMLISHLMFISHAPNGAKRNNAYPIRGRRNERLDHNQVFAPERFIPKRLPEPQPEASKQ